MGDDRRDREPGVEYDATRRVLRVGQRERRLPRRADNRDVLTAYLALVAAQRPAAPRERVHLRDRDVDMLAELLDLTDEALEEHLADLLGLTDVEAHVLGKRLRAGRIGLAAAAMGVSVLSLAPLAHSTGSPGPVPAVVTHDDRAPSEAVPPPSSQVTVTPPAVAEPQTEPELGPATVVERDPDGGTISYVESAPAPISEDGTDIGTALVIERS